MPKPDFGTTSSLPVRALLRALEAADVDVVTLTRGLDLDVAALADPEARIPTTTTFALLARGAELTRNPEFGLLVGASVTPGVLEVLDHATRASSNAGDALARVTRYYALVIERVQLAVETTGDVARLVHRRPPKMEVPRQAVEMLFGAVVARGRALTGVDWPMRRVRFVHPRPASTEALDAFFRAPISFDEPCDELVFDASFLETPLATADPSLSALLDRYADTLLAKLAPMDDGVLSDVRRAIADTLRGGDPSLPRTAARLGVGVRTLQRRLTAAGQTYAGVVDDVRCELATTYLAQARLSFAEIGYLLGFAQTGAFHRAFKRWTGKTPKQYRDELPPSPTGSRPHLR